MKILAIDQSLKATGICMLDDDHEGPLPPVLETVRCHDIVGFQRVDRVVNRANGLIDEHLPEVLVFEGYDFGSNTNNLAQVAELVGAIQYHAQHTHGYVLGYGCGHNKEERTVCRSSSVEADRLIVCQTSGSMKKFCLGNGSKAKDSAYLLNVMERINRRFEDDNQADAYMHAWMASQILAVIRRQASISDLTLYQQEALITAVAGSAKHLPKGMSLTKVLKLPDEEKLALITI